MFMVRWFGEKPAKNPVNSHAADKSLEFKLPSKIMTPVNPTATDSNDINMPGGVMNMMLGYVDNNMSTVSSHGPLVATLFNSLKTRKLQDLRALIAASANGKPDETKALLDKDSSLALEKLEEGDFVISLSGHRFNMHPYQVALAVDDTQMAALIRPYFVEQKEADRQYDEQCPKGWEIAEAEKWKPIFKQRDKLLRAIRDGKDDITSSGNPHYIATERKGSDVANELAEFYRLLDATLDEVITAGKRPFNPNLLLEPLQMYDDDRLYKEYFGGSRDDPRALFFIQKVIGYEGIQRFMPVNYVQAHQERLDETAEKLRSNEPQARGTCFQIYRCNIFIPYQFYPLLPRGIPDFNWAIMSLMGVCRLDGADAYGGVARHFEALCQSKTACSQSLCRSTQTTGLSR